MPHINVNSFSGERISQYTYGGPTPDDFNDALKQGPGSKEAQFTERPSDMVHRGPLPIPTSTLDLEPPKVEKFSKSSTRSSVRDGHLVELKTHKSMKKASRPEPEVVGEIEGAGPRPGAALRSFGAPMSPFDNKAPSRHSSTLIGQSNFNIPGLVTPEDIAHAAFRSAARQVRFDEIQNRDKPTGLGSLELTERAWKEEVHEALADHAQEKEEALEALAAHDPKNKEVPEALAEDAQEKEEEHEALAKHAQKKGEEAHEALETHEKKEEGERMPGASLRAFLRTLELPENLIYHYGMRYDR
jgi:hypothetical protein